MTHTVESLLSLHDKAARHDCEPLRTKYRNELSAALTEALAQQSEHVWKRGYEAGHAAGKRFKTPEQAREDNAAIGAALSDAFRNFDNEPQAAQPILGTKTWIEGGVVMTQNLTASDIYLPPQAAQSIECECGRIHKKTPYGWASNEAAQPVREPLSEQQINAMWIAEMRKKLPITLPTTEFARSIEQAHGIGGGE